MKRVISAILCGLMLMGSMMLPTAADTADEPIEAKNVLLIAPAPAKRDVTAHEANAVALKKLGLFMGVSDTDFDLERAPTRLEALVMLIRVLGKEEASLQGKRQHPFTDVPVWDGDKANKYVGYAYVNKLTNGMDEAAGIFGSYTNATAQMYLTFVLRALGYTDKDGADFTYADPFTLAKEVGILNDTINTEEFWRADVAAVSYLALEAKLKGTEITLADKLIEAGVFTMEEYCEATGKELPPLPETVKNADLKMSGKAKKNADGTVTVGGGAANRAYLAGGFQASHYAMSAKFTVAEDSETFSFVMGKDGSQFGYWAEAAVIDGKSYVLISNNTGYTGLDPEKKALDFDLTCGKEYTLKMTFDILHKTTGGKQMTVEVFGEGDEYFKVATSCNGYGNPFYYSNAKGCIVSDFDLSIQHYFDVENAKIAIFGHSFVEADTMGSDRKNGFAYLFETEFTKKHGDGTVLNFGLGGDNVTGMYNKIVNSERFVKNCDYALLCIGTNDRSSSADAFLDTLKKAIKALEDMGITPILFTVPHGDYEMKDSMKEVNEWIKESGYDYVDMYKVFANSDGSCKQSMFMADKIHPTAEGQKAIFNQIKKDCPFLFD